MKRKSSGPGKNEDPNNQDLYVRFPESCTRLASSRLIYERVFDWIPASKKNGQRIVRFGKRASIRPSKQWDKDCKRLRAEFLETLQGELPLVPPGHDVGVSAKFIVGKRKADARILIRFYDMGSAPARGTYRDLDNVVQGILDAAQGIIYRDDRRVSLMDLERIRV